MHPAREIGLDAEQDFPIQRFRAETFSADLKGGLGGLDPDV